MAKSREGWTLCEVCGRSTAGHKISGLTARCLDGRVMIVSEFEVAELRESLGIGLSHQMRGRLAKMRTEQKASKP